MRRNMKERCITREDMRNARKILVGKPDGKKPFRRCKHGLLSNIEMHLKETG
jgi:predicted Abi (CAAX) family protease